MFYLDKVSITMTCVEEMMYLANKYDVSESFRICERFLKESIENICHVLKLAVTFGRDELLKYSLRKVEEKPTQILASNSFKNCNRNVLQLILEIKNLDCNEKAVFDACTVWSEEACNKNDMDPLIMNNRRIQ